MIEVNRRSHNAINAPDQPLLRNNTQETPRDATHTLYV